MQSNLIYLQIQPRANHRSSRNLRFCVIAVRAGLYYNTLTLEAVLTAWWLTAIKRWSCGYSLVSGRKWQEDILSVRGGSLRDKTPRSFKEPVQRKWLPSPFQTNLFYTMISCFKERLSPSPLTTERSFMTETQSYQQRRWPVTGQQCIDKHSEELWGTTDWFTGNNTNTK